MSEGWRILLTSVSTIIGGIVILVLGQLAQRFFVDPLHEHANVKGEIAYALIYYGFLLTNTPRPHSDEPASKASDEVRKLASKLVAATVSIRAPSLMSFLRLAPPRSSSMKAAKQLIRLSNSIFSGSPAENTGTKDLISRLLELVMMGEVGATPTSASGETNG